MKVEFRESFLKDLGAIRDKKLAQKVREVIELLEAAESLLSVSNIKKLRGEKGFYRLRIGEYRLGILQDGESIALVRFLNRKEIYRFFP